MNRAISLFAILLLAGCSQAAHHEQAAPHKEVLAPNPSPLPVFSPAVRSGNLVFLSGQLGLKPGTFELVPGGIQAETEQTLKGIRRLLGEIGLEMTDVVKCTVFLADIADYAKMNEIYLRYFPSEPPARSALAASGLVLGARVEIECIAAVRG